MAEVNEEIRQLRERADFYRRLARDHAAAENRLIASKLDEVVRDLEARIDKLECARRRREI
jgi:replicative superfamily II helicase